MAEERKTDEFARFQEIFMVFLLGFLLYNNYQEYSRLGGSKGPTRSFYGY